MFTHEDMAVSSIIVVFGNIRDTLQVLLNAPTIARQFVIKALKSGLRACGIGNHSGRTDRQSDSLQTYGVRLQRVDVEFWELSTSSWRFPCLFKLENGWKTALWWRTQVLRRTQWLELVSFNNHIPYPTSAFCEQLHVLWKFKPNWVVPFWPCAPHSGKGPVVSTIQLPNSIIPDPFRQTQLYLTSSSPTRLCI